MMRLNTTLLSPSDQDRLRGAISRGKLQCVSTVRLQSSPALPPGWGLRLRSDLHAPVAASRCSTSTRPQAEASAQRIGGIGIACDVADATSAEAAVAKARDAHGPARLLVNCAGVGTAGRIVGRDGPLPLAAFERVIRVNLIGSFNLLRLAAADMSALDPLEDGERGVIVNTASIAAYEGQVGQAAYAASKAGVVGMTLPAARELARVGVRVVSDRARSVPHTDGRGAAAGIAARAWPKAFPFRSGSVLPEEYAALVEHIATNRFLNGETIRFDGALRMPPR